MTRLARWRRPLTVAAIAAVLGGPAVVDRVIDRSEPSAIVRIRASNPSATPASSGASTWFCTSGRTTSEGKPDLTVTTANPTEVDIPGRITWYSSESGTAPVVQPLLLGANARVDTDAPTQIAGGAIGALVEFDGGGITAEHRVSGPNGGARAVCASAASAQWITADGTTTVDAKTTLSVFNPFPEDALLDVRFVTERGSALPAALQGLSIAAESVQTINVGDYVRRRTNVSAIVRARIGRVVVERTTTFDGTGRSKGTTVSPASPAASPTWYFASGRATSVLRERYAMFNPTRSPVTAVIDVLIDGSASAEPFEIDIPAMSTVALVPGSESRVPRDVGYSVVVSTDDGSAIVVERTVIATGRLRNGYASSPGILAPSERWLIADAGASSKRSDMVSILNPTDTDAVLSLHLVGDGTDLPIDGASKVLVRASGRLDIRLGDYAAVDNQSLLISSPGAPIIVERWTQNVSKQGSRPVVDPLPSTEDEASSSPLTGDTLPPSEPSPTTGAPSSAPTTAEPTTAPSTAPAPAIPAALALTSPSSPTTATASTSAATTTAAGSAASTAASATATTAAAATTTAPGASSSTSTTTNSAAASTTTTTTSAATTTAAPTTTTTAGVSNGPSRAAAPRIGVAGLGTSVGGAIPLP